MYISTHHGALLIFERFTWCADPLTSHVNHGRPANKPGITKIRGSMIYNSVMGTRNDTAYYLPAGIIAGN